MFFKYTDNKIVRYIISGGTAALVSLSLLYLFTDIFGIWYLVSSSMAFVFAFVVSFLLQKLWTFKNTQTHDIMRQVSLYFITATLGLSANVLFMYVLVDVFGLWYMLAQIFSSGAIAVITFFVYGNVIFNHTQKGSILVATGLYPPDIGGPATYTRLLEEELPRRGIQVIVASFGNVRRLPKIIRHIIYFLKLCFVGTEAEIIYALDPVSVGLPALIAAKLLRKKFLLRVAGDYAWEQFQVNQESGARNQEFVTLEEFQERKFDFVTEVRRKIERFVANNANHVIVPSKYLKSIVRQWDIPEEKIKIIYTSFVPPTYAHYLAERTKIGVRAKFPNLKGKIIVSAGRLIVWKGFAVLIDIISELKNRFSDIQLVIIGDGPEKQNLELKASRLEFEKGTIIFTGNLSRNQVLEYLRAADVFVLNTGYEGLSHQILEAMTIGIPVVTTNSGGNPELIEDQKTGFLVKFNDKRDLINKITDIFNEGVSIDGKKDFILGATARRCVENAKKKAQQFSSDQSVKSLVTLFDHD